jgi:hypothetical protein
MKQDRKYVVAFQHPQDASIDLEIIWANNALDAMLSFLDYDHVPEGIDTAIELQDWLWDTEESLINCIEV